MLFALVVSITFKIIFDIKAGSTLTKSLLETLAWSAVTYALMFGLFWYLSTQVFKPGTPIFTFPLPATPTPKP
jgi:hypothetical protein